MGLPLSLRGHRLLPRVFKLCLASQDEPVELAFTPTGFPCEVLASEKLPVIPEVPDYSIPIYSLEACWSVVVKTCDKFIPFLIDTGASVNILSAFAFEQIKKDQVACGPSKVQLTGANGDPVVVKGEVELDLEIEGELFPTGLVVADVAGTQGILGVPFLRGNDCIIQLSSGTLECRGQKWELHQLSPTGVVQILDSRIRIGEPTEVQVKLEGQDSAWQPYTALLDRAGIVAVSTEIRQDQGQRLVELCNVGSQENSIPSGVVIGTVSTSSQIASLSCVGHSTEANIGPDRRDGSHSSPDGEGEPELAHLETMIEESTAGLSSAQATAVRGLIRDNLEVFVGVDGKPGRTHLVLHEIPTGNAIPSRQPMRRMSPAHRIIVDQEVEQMLADGVIEPSNSPWSSPVVLVRKKNIDRPRFCVDYRTLNSVTIKDAYALANIQDCLDSLRGAVYFSTMDLASGYWQVELHTDAKEKTAFPTR